MHQNTGEIQHRRGSSPCLQPPDRRVDPWGEGRMRSIKETPEDSFAINPVAHLNDYPRVDESAFVLPALSDAVAPTVPGQH
jgi:hypothetical protein